MIGSLAVYSSSTDPRRIYSIGPVEDPSERPAQVVGAGDRPLALLVDFADDRLLWSFKADWRTKATRTGYFVAEYRGDGDEGPPLLEGAAARFRALEETDGWEIHRGDPRWELGFLLAERRPNLSGLSPDDRGRLRERVRADPASGPGTVPTEISVPDYRVALEVVAAVADMDAPVTVALGENVDPGTLADVDVFLRLEGGRAGDAETAGSDATVDEGVAANGAGGPGAASGSSPVETIPGGSTLETVGSRVAGIALLLMAGFTLYSFVAVRPVHPISGLSAIGGALGTALGGAVAWTWASRGVGRGTGLASLRAGLARNPQGAVMVLAAGTFLGFVFPTVFRVGGIVLISQRWLLGLVSTIPGAFLSVFVYVAVLAGLTLGTVRLAGWDRSGAGDRVVQAVAAGYLVYALALFLANGLARALWFGLIPST